MKRREILQNKFFFVLFCTVVTVVVAAENISRTAAELITLVCINYWVHSGYVQPTAAEVDKVAHTPCHAVQKERVAKSMEISYVTMFLW